MKQKIFFFIFLEGKLHRFYKSTLINVYGHVWHAFIEKHSLTRSLITSHYNYAYEMPSQYLKDLKAFSRFSQENLLAY